MANEYQEQKNITEVLASLQKLNDDGLDFSYISQAVDVAKRIHEASPQIGKTLLALGDVYKIIEAPILRQLAEPLFDASKLGKAITFDLQLFAAWEKNEKAANRLRFLDSLRDKKWPLFLIRDEALIDSVMQAWDSGADNSTICGLVSDYFLKGFLEQTEERWRNNTLIRDERIPVLLEALEMHKAGHFYSSVSILMCQVYGVASDIIDLEKRHGLVVEIESKKKVAKAFKIEEKNIDTEKGKIAQGFLFVRHSIVSWQAVIEYLNSEILCSSQSKRRWETQPLRNKICHGDQLNYGTLEHSLKAILVIDMLLEYAAEIEFACKKQNGLQEETHCDE